MTRNRTGPVRSAAAVVLVVALAGCAGPGGAADDGGPPGAANDETQPTAAGHEGQPDASDDGAQHEAVTEGDGDQEAPGGGDAEQPAPPAVGEFCDAVAALNEFPESDQLSPAERERALRTVDDLLRLWPAGTQGAAATYFGEIRDAIVAGTAVDLDNTSEEFREAFLVTFESAADACPGGFG